MRIDVKKSVEQFEIGEKTYQLDVSDDLLFQYEEKFGEMQRKSGEEITFEEQTELVKEMLNFMFKSDTAGEEIYQECGKSTFHLISVVEQILEHLAVVLTEKKNTKLKKYLNKK